MAVLSTAFWIASRLRRARAFHPRGAVWHGTWQPGEVVGPDGQAAVPGPCATFVRISHGVGLPPHLPDILGLAIKVIDAHGPGRDQDLLLASTGHGRLTRHLLRPAKDLAGTSLSTILPYRVGDGVRPVLARAATSVPLRYERLVGTSAPPLPRFEVRLGTLDGPLVGTVAHGEAADPALGEALRFDPWHTGPALRPTGWLNRIRRPTYAASQDGRAAPPMGWRGVTAETTADRGEPR